MASPFRLYNTLAREVQDFQPKGVPLDFLDQRHISDSAFHVDQLDAPPQYRNDIVGEDREVHVFCFATIPVQFPYRSYII